jgi:hypothetical protein
MQNISKKNSRSEQPLHKPMKNYLTELQLDACYIPFLPRIPITHYRHIKNNYILVIMVENRRINAIWNGVFLVVNEP